MGRIWAISINTFREAVRDRVLVGLLGGAASLIAFSLVLGQLSLNNERRVVHDVGFGAISIFSVIAAVFLGASLLYKEIERKTLYVILPKPIHRFEFLLGKYFGVLLTGAVFIAFEGSLQMLALASQWEAGSWLLGCVLCVNGLGAVVLLVRSTDTSYALLAWSICALTLSFGVAATTEMTLAPRLAQLVLTFLELAVLSAVTMFFSSFSTPFLTGLFTFGVWLVGRSVDVMLATREEMVGRTTKAMLNALVHVVPNFNLFAPNRATLEKLSGEFGGVWAYVASGSGYALLYSCIVSALACFFFSRRDFL
ncbi:MAG: hypothetical protein AAF355_05380 [Myxococcota bacterium]